MLAAVDGMAPGRFTQEHARDHQPPLTLPPMRFFMDSGLAEGVSIRIRTRPFRFNPDPSKFMNDYSAFTSIFLPRRSVAFRSNPH